MRWNCDTVEIIARRPAFRRSFYLPAPRPGVLCRWWRRVCTRMLDGQPDAGMLRPTPRVARAQRKRAIEVAARIVFGENNERKANDC